MPEEATLILGRDPVLLTRVVEWCGSRDHAGVRGEACRLLAALIRHSRSPVSHLRLRPASQHQPSAVRSDWMCPSVLQDVVRAVAHVGGVQHLISMATSEHVIMQNEALVALTIASAADIGEGNSYSD